MRYINELREGDNVSEVYLCKVKNIAKTKAGKTYYSMILQDKTGVIDTKIWDLNNGIENFEQMDYIRVEGNVTSFQGSPQLNVRRLRKAREGEFAMEDYIPCSSKSIDGMFQELSSYVNHVLFTASIIKLLSLEIRNLQPSSRHIPQRKEYIMDLWAVC